MTKRNLIIVIVLLVVVIIGYFVLQNLRSTKLDQGVVQVADQELVTESTDENAQSAYLVGAYTKNGKNYIDVDFVEWLHGEPSISAQVEDGKCMNAQDCYDFPNGYQRNRNPLVRTFEVSPDVVINVSGSIASVYDALTEEKSLTFAEFVDASKKTIPLEVSDAAFKKPITFIIIGLENNMVTKIHEPYQE
jgi:hypothetical protein